MIMWIPYQIIRGHKDFWHLQVSLLFWVWKFGQNVKSMDPQYLYYTNGYVHLNFWDDSPPVIHLLRMAWLDKSVGPAVGSFRQKPHQKIYDDKI